MSINSESHEQEQFQFAIQTFNFRSASTCSKNSKEIVNKRLLKDTFKRTKNLYDFTLLGQFHGDPTMEATYKMFEKNDFLI